MTESHLDAMLQKNVGIYVPRSEKRDTAPTDVDDSDIMPVEDLADEDFMKALRKEKPSA